MELLHRTLYFGIVHEIGSSRIRMESLMGGYLPHSPGGLQDPGFYLIGYIFFRDFF